MKELIEIKIILPKILNISNNNDIDDKKNDFIKIRNRIKFSIIIKDKFIHIINFIIFSVFSCENWIGSNFSIYF